MIALAYGHRRGGVWAVKRAAPDRSRDATQAPEGGDHIGSLVRKIARAQSDTQLLGYARQLRHAAREFKA